MLCKMAGDGVFSIRLVIADFYMEKPVPGLDPVYSEFRGKEIKKVPIIRVFGSNAQGQKTCMHVHGVFPYFYVPYDQKDFDSVNKAIYLIAINLDKAINISLSQGSSSVQHVFKVQLVKGIPFYGYHRSEHHFLKIYMFNPRFVRRAANLLQNGAIMNKNFHPHEAHVPYVLQFMIDYNLYGMSFIHVPSEIVKFRRSDASEVIPVKNLKEPQILDFNTAKKLSCSRLECDIGSNFILNRFQLIAKTSSTHTNPGIESIWHDEKLRRQKMAQLLEDDEEKLNAIPPLEVPSTQERPNVVPTESETFYRTALVSKLLAMENSLMENTQVSDQTINCTLQSSVTNITLNTSLATMTKQQKRTFNLTKMLQNSVYPEECSQHENLVNASFVENHLSNNNAFQQSLSMDLTELVGSDNLKLSQDESLFLDDTIVDEELVLSLTQSQQQHVPHNATLRQEDMELLEILQQLEEDNNDGKIDLDSSLAPLTQDNKNFALSPELLDKETTASVMRQPPSDADSDEEHDNDDNVHDFSVALESLDDLILKLTQNATEESLVSPLPQTDGSDDLLKTPTKASATTSSTKTPPRTPTTPKQRRLTLASPSRSPRTPRSGHKYKPLPLIITNRSTGKKVFTNTSVDMTSPNKTPDADKTNNLPLLSLRKKLAMTELRRKSISVETNAEDNQHKDPAIGENKGVVKRRSKRATDLDKTHITCNLTPRRTNDKLLKVYSVDTDAVDLKENETQHNDTAAEGEDLKGNSTRRSSTAKSNEKKKNTNQSTKNDNCKYRKHSKEEDSKSVKVKENDIKSISPSPANDRKDAHLKSLDSADEENEEILDSDNETDYPPSKLAKTPNLKRLRRSFRATHSAKRRKIASNEDEVIINSSKFENSNILKSPCKIGRQQENFTNSEGDNAINSSKFEKVILEKEKHLQQEQENKASAKTNIEIGIKKCSIKLRKLTKNLQSAETPEVFIKSVKNESTHKIEDLLRKSKRLASNGEQDNFCKNQDSKETQAASQSKLQTKITSLNKGSSPKAANESSCKEKLLQTKESPTKINPVLVLKKCRIRLKKIANENPKTINNFGVTEISEDSGKILKATPATKQHHNPQIPKVMSAMEIPENSAKKVEATSKTKMLHESQRTKDLGIVEIPKKSEKNNDSNTAKDLAVVELTAVAMDDLKLIETPTESQERINITSKSKEFPSKGPTGEFNESGKTSAEQILSSQSMTARESGLFLLMGESGKCVETNHRDSSETMGTLQITEECVKSTTETKYNKNSKTKGHLEYSHNAKESLESLKIIGETMPLDIPAQSEEFKTSNSLQQKKSTDTSLHSPNTDNLLKSLAKLTSTDSKEWRLTASPSLGDSSNLPLAQPVDCPSQTPSIEFIFESPLPQSSDEEIAETPPPLPPTFNDNEILHFHEKSMSFQHSPALFTQNSSPSVITQNKHFRNTLVGSSENNSKDECIAISSSNETAAAEKNSSSPPLESAVVLTPLDMPPTREEVLKGCLKLKLPEYEFQQPFYSNPDDITKHKEIGFTILQINSNKLNDLEEFQSILGSDVKGLAAWRRNQLLRLGGPAMLTKYRNTQRIREYFATQKTVAIAPQMSAPTRQEVKMWLKARELLKTKGALTDADDERKTMQRLGEEDSPIKIRRQKVALMLNNEGGGDDDSDNSLDCSSRSLTLTPLTPSTPLTKDSLKEKINKSFTPVTTKIEKIPLERLHLQRRRHNRRVLKRVSLNQKMKEALDKTKFTQNSLDNLEEGVETISKTSQNTENCIEVLDKEISSPNSLISRPSSKESIVPHSQTSETSVSSQTALAEMERSSFMRQIEQLDVTMGGSNNNSTLNNSYGFKVALENLQQAKADIEFNYLTIITLEVFVATRDDLFPNPQIDEIRCLFYAIENSIPSENIDSDKKLPRKACGYIMVHDSRDSVGKEGRIHGIDSDIEVTIVHTEVEALEALLGLCSRWDADIYAGYEIEMSSWGFVIERAKYLCLNIAPLLSRVPTQKVRDFVDEDRDQFTDLDVEMKLCGRILLDVWRLMRSEIALTSYTFENVMYHIMHKRCPWHNYRTLTEWFASPCCRWIVIEYYLERVRGTLGLLDQLDLIGRTSEMAKLIGIQFYEVLSRGSQFRVESMMLRIAKPKNLVPLSPSVQQRAHMRAPEYLALILEPQSRFYADPVIVLDFQSLYPSMIIGYNYCFSTCLGRVEHLGQSTPFEFGASQLRVSPTMLRKLVDRDLITISPCGVVFVKASVREGILPRMLTEILDTRQMVKQSMKIHKSNSALQRILHSRQLGLKLMANVTYGYTAANFSGRMPAVEVGDTVVSKGRETLEKAIKMVEANEKWNVKVVYGDTDSLFVLVPGRNREEAFRIGEEIAEAVTKQNPHPVKLKLEKVYQPCILQTKKRYVGYMYETADQKEPVYEAKGIETVRRDGCPMVAKMLEKVLRILFESADVSQVKQYVCRQFTKLLSGRANLQDLIFAKEFRGMNGYKPTACVPALEMTRKWIQTDPRHIPRRGERVPFIITNGPPGVPLIRLIRHPHEVLADEGLKINAIYYITKAIIPPLNRCLLLIGADVNEWFTNLPRKILMTPALSIANEVIACPNSKSKKSTISQFFSTTNCIVDCGRQTKQGICDVCNGNATRSTIILQTKISKIERAYLSTQHICQACCGRVGDLKCGSLDCPVLYVMEVKRRDLQQIVHFRNLLEERF